MLGADIEFNGYVYHNAYDMLVFAILNCNHDSLICIVNYATVRNVRILLCIMRNPYPYCMTEQL
jgi:hypothetical protein